MEELKHISKIYIHQCKFSAKPCDMLTAIDLHGAGLSGFLATVITTECCALHTHYQTK